MGRGSESGESGVRNCRKTRIFRERGIRKVERCKKVCVWGGGIRTVVRSQNIGESVRTVGRSQNSKEESEQ